MKIIYQEHVHFGQHDEKGRSVGAWVTLYRERGETRVQLHASRNRQAYGATPRGTVPTSMEPEALRADIERKLTRMHKRYAKLGYGHGSSPKLRALPTEVTP